MVVSFFCAFPDKADRVHCTRFDRPGGGKGRQYVYQGARARLVSVAVSRGQARLDTLHAMTEKDRPGMDDIGSQKFRVHIAQGPSEATSYLQSLLDPAIRLTLESDEPWSEAQVLVLGRPSREQLAACPNLQALIIPYAGVPSETRVLLLDRHPDLPVYNLHHNAAAAAELAMALFLAAAKTLLPVDRQFRRNDWRSRYEGAPLLLVEGKTAVILGYGAIGERLAAMCRALGMHVHAVRRRAVDPAPDGVRLHELKDLPTLLPAADALFIALPLTPETHGLLGREQIDRLPSSCVLVNIARGAIVEEGALYHALKDRRIAAAGLDVWYNYPSTPASRADTPPSHFPFHELDNIIMSPHRGGAFQLAELERQRMSALAHTLNAIVRGEVPPHRVDLRAGY
jgi:phosphoglycerate dehydrogenase-like enzyme